MLKFFRKLRSDALSQKGFPKYITYAIGEIFLVVIGILIAENLAPSPPTADGFS